MPEYNCLICNSSSYKKLFSKNNHKDYQLVKCKSCSHESLFPVPNEKELLDCYAGQYFEKRTDRGYDNYFSSNIRNEIERVFKMNLKDLEFDHFENALKDKKSSLDIGCAAGYFVAFLKSKKWKAMGIDVSPSCIKFAKESLNLDVTQGSYLEKQYQNEFQLITLWATIEHLSDPGPFLDKMYNDLDDDGMVYISTCRTGQFNFKNLFGKKWRYYNFPEHIHFYSYRNLKKYLYAHGFKIKKYFTYGSGISSKHSVLKRLSDFFAKKLFAGDMMIVSAVKRSNYANKQ